MEVSMDHNVALRGQKKRIPGPGIGSDTNSRVEVSSQFRNTDPNELGKQYIHHRLDGASLEEVALTKVHLVVSPTTQIGPSAEMLDGCLNIGVIQINKKA